MGDKFTPGYAGKLVREMRIKRRMTQRDLAKKAGVSPSKISNLEGGQTTDIKFEAFLVLLKSLDYVMVMKPKEKVKK